MKRKYFFLACLSAMLMVACSGGNGGGENIFGEIPGIYRHEMKKIAGEVKNIQKEAESDKENQAEGLEKAMHALTIMQGAMEKAKEQSASIAEKMVGREINSIVSETLPYKVDRFEITDVVLPKFNMKGISELKIKTDLALVLNDAVEERPLYVYYTISNGKEDFYCDRLSISNSAGYVTSDAAMQAGDTLVTQRATLEEPEIPLDLLESCNVVRFIDKEEYASVQATISSKREQWKKEAEKDWE